MSNLSKLFTTGEVLTPSRSGYDMSHENLFTAMVGTITPMLVEEVCGNTDVSIGVACKVNLPPMAVDFFGRIDACLEAFFCPYRLCYGGWEDYIGNLQSMLRGFTANGLTTPVSGTSGVTAVNQYETPVNPRLPYAGGISPSQLGPGSLADMLGYKIPIGASSTGVTIDNILPFVAYHRIYESFYRPANLQKPAFVKPDIKGSTPINFNQIKYLPFVRESVNSNSAVESFVLNDGVSLFSLRQRCFNMDRFTQSRVTPLGGTASFTQTTSALANSPFNVFIQTQETQQGATAAGISVGSIRTANILQEWIDRYNIVGPKYRDAMYAKYGCKPHQCCVEPIFLGRTKFNCYNKSIYQSQAETDTSIAEGNPFNTVGSEYARTEASGANSLVQNFHCSENGVIMVMFTLVPHAYYSTGVRRYLMNKHVSDFGDELLQNLGDDVIYSRELSASAGASDVFAYTPRYSHYLYHDDEVHGLFRDGESLDVYALQRSFPDPTQLGNISLDFVLIPKDYLDGQSVTSANVSNFGCWVDAFFSEKIVTPLTNSVIPTLGKPVGLKRSSVKLNGNHM